MTLAEGTIVRVHYRGTLDDGTEFDSSAGREPLEFTLGTGQVIEGFEDAVVDLAVGDKTSVEITPADAYGDRVDEAVQRVPIDAFADDQPPVGAMVQVQAPDGQIMVATVTEMDDESVELDFNHPLAGKTLTFEIELVEVVEVVEG